MPPRLTGPTIRPTPEQPRGVRPNALQVAGAAVQGIGQATDALAREVQRLDEIRVNEALAEYGNTVDTLLNDPNDGILTRRGKDAVGAFDGFSERVKLRRGDVEATLGNENQKALFRAQSERLVREADRRAFAYLEAETQRTDIAATQALQERDFEQVIALAGDAEAADAVVRQMRERAILFGDRQRQDPAVTERAVAELTSKARLAQVTTLASGENPDAAQTVLQRVSGEMVASDRARAQAAVEAGSLAVRSQRASADLFTAFGPDDERAALAEARRQFEGKMQDEVVRRLELRYADERRLRNEQVQQYSDQAMTAAYQGQPIPRDVETWLEANGQGRVLAAAQNVRLAQANGEPVQTNLAAYQELSDMLLPENRNAFLKVNLLAYADRVSASDLKGFINAQTALRGGSRSPSAGVSTATVMTETFNQAMASKMFDPERVRRLGDLEKYPEDKAIYETLRGAVDAALQAARDDQKTELSPSQVRTIIRQTLDGFIIEENDGGWLGFASRSARPITAAESLARREAQGRRLGPPGMAPANQRLRQLQAQGIPLASIEAQMRREGYTDADFEAAATLSRNP